MSDEKKQDNPIEILERIRKIAQSLDDETILNDAINADFVHLKAGVIVALADSLLESAKDTRQISSYSVSFWLKVCEPLPAQDESALKPREWQIDSSEVDDNDIDLSTYSPPFGEIWR